MKKFFTKFSLAAVAILLSASFSVYAQSSSSDSAFKPKGQLWGYLFGDYAFKANADTTGLAKLGKGRGGSNQYTNPNYANNGKNLGQFQIRRIYLGYNYDISPKFSAEFLLAMEDDFNTASSSANPPYSGDVLADGKFAPYVKLANIRWKQIFPGTDLVFGEVATPAFPLLTEVVWGYRSIERTVSDIRRTPSFDLGATLQGRFIPSNDNYGYNIMVGNGKGAVPENDMYKWFYADVYAKFFDKHLLVDIYQDYQRLNQGWNTTINGMWEHDRNMTKIYIAWTEPKFTVGLEAFQNTLLGDNFATLASDGKTVKALTTKATDISVYVRGKIYKDKLGFFARYDNYNPAGNIDNNTYVKYTPQTSQYDPNTKENFMTFGIDYTPVKNVHIMPNIWYNSYTNAGYQTVKNGALAGYSSVPDGNDMVYRLTFYYIYGK